MLFDEPLYSDPIRANRNRMKKTKIDNLTKLQNEIIHKPVKELDGIDFQTRTTNVKGGYLPLRTSRRVVGQIENLYKATQVLPPKSTLEVLRSDKIHEVPHATVFRRDLKFIIDVDRAIVKDTLTEVSSMAIKLGAMYTGYKIAAKILDVVNVALSGRKDGLDVVNVALSGRKDGHEVQNVQPSIGLHVLLHCSTNERFLEVFEDFKSGRMKERLQLEFSFANIKTEGLVVKIENIKKVKGKIAVINRLKK